MSNRCGTIEELAQACGINRATIYRWRKDGWGIDELFDEAAGGWDPAEVTAWSKDMKRARRKILRPAFDVDVDDDSLDAGEGSRDWGVVYRKAKAVLATLQARRLQDSLVDRAEMERGFAMRVAEITPALDAMASQLAPRNAPLTREAAIQAWLREAFHQLRDHYARDDDDPEGWTK